MNAYREFARFYAKGQYYQYSKKMAEALPDILEQFNVYPTTILDLACGEGTFIVETHRSRYDIENNVATLHITGFMRENEENKWIRIDEEYKERGYTTEEIRQCLHNTGLQELALWGDIK